MVDYIGMEGIQRLVERVGTAAFIEGLAREIHADYRRWAEFDKSARHAIHSPGGVIELMPTSDGRLYSFKYVNGHPKNTDAGLLTVTAFGVLADVRTGYPLLLSEMTVTTALRTAAMSALAARHLARPDSRVMALIGNGAQSEFQALAFHHLLGIEEIHLYDIDAGATAKLMRNLQSNPDTATLRLRACGSIAEAVQDADIVTTVTADKTNAAIITAGMLKPGTHLNAVGGDCPGKTEIYADALRAAKVFVEYEPQTRVEGDLQQMGPDFAVTELWQVLSGEKAGRDSAAQITMFDSVGFALEDFSALRYLYDTAQSLAVGGSIPLIPRLDDPKNLYQLVRPGFSAAPLQLSPSVPLSESFVLTGMKQTALA